MKKLKLEQLGLVKSNLLKTAELKTTLGGYGGNSAACTASCSGGHVVTCTGASCTATDDIGCTGDDGSRSC